MENDTHTEDPVKCGIVMVRPSFLSWIFIEITRFSWVEQKYFSIVEDLLAFGHSGIPIRNQINKFYVSQTPSIHWLIYSDVPARGTKRLLCAYIQLFAWTRLGQQKHSGCINTIITYWRICYASAMNQSMYCALSAIASNSINDYYY